MPDRQKFSHIIAGNCVNLENYSLSPVIKQKNTPAVQFEQRTEFMVYSAYRQEGNVMPKTEQARARELVKQYGQNPHAYLTLEEDKSLYFGKAADGVIAYGIVGGTMVICGDPIAAPGDFVCLLREFKDFCKKHARQCVFLGTTDCFLAQYSALGYHHVKYGEEARFRLADYQLAGGKMARIRADINHAKKAGRKTYEYRPKENRDPAIERGMQFVSDQWLQGKSGDELGFTTSRLALGNPTDQRYFYAVNTAGEIAAFHVFLPFAGMNGYIADITRRVPGTPGGVTEKINYDAFMTFRDEGIEWGSLGVAPLANVLDENEKHDINARVLNIIEKRCKGFYDFKALQLAKVRYSPTMWVPSYLVYSSKNLTPQMLYAIVKIQSPGGLMGHLRGFFHVKVKRKTGAIR
jgi:phosphatidylglycerol lysyltransferase